MAEYRFCTLWRVDAPLQTVWEAIAHPEAWPCWWKSLQQVQEVEKGNAAGVGALHRYTWKGALPYRLTFSIRVLTIDPLCTLEGQASGEVQGNGRWRFHSDGSGTVVRYDWHIHTNRWWMNLLAPLARPLFEWNHDVVMRNGAEGLARLLGTRVETDNRTFEPSPSSPE